MSGAYPWLGDLGAIRGIGSFIDYTLLRPEATRAQILQLCDEARSLGVKTVCVNGSWVETCVEQLRGSPVLVTTVVGFPLGGTATAAKVAETRLAVAAGAAEVDMVLALGRAKAGEWREVENDIRPVVQAAGGAAVKVILETAALEPNEVVAGCLAAQAAGASFVKTSTGFHPAGGATVETVALMRQTVGTPVGVKASGGIRTAEVALRMLAAGANRIGTSSGSALDGYVGPSAPVLSTLLHSATRGGNRENL